MKLGEGAKGIAYTVKCTTDDSETICHMLKQLNIKSIKLYEFNSKFRIRDRGLINAFVDSLEKAEKYAAKTFKRKLFINRKAVFDDEVAGIRNLAKVFGSDTANLTTVMPLKFMDRDIIAIEVETDGDTFYSVFNEKCENTLENIPMTHADLRTMVKDMLKSFIILQKHRSAHTDVKPANIVKCAKKYKLIDWEMMRDLTKHNYGIVKRASVSALTSSPWSYYISGYPAFLAYSYINSSIANKNPEYAESQVYKELSAFVDAEYKHILSWDMNKDELFDKYANTIDNFSLAASIVYLCWKNKLSIKPYQKWVTRCLSAHPPVNSREAYKLWVKG